MTNIRDHPRLMSIGCGSYGVTGNLDEKMKETKKQKKVEGGNIVWLRNQI